MNRLICALVGGLLSLGTLGAEVIAVDVLGDRVSLNSPAEIQSAKDLVWKHYREQVIKDGDEKALGDQPKSMKDWFENGVVKSFLIEKIGEVNVPYIVVTKGEKPEGGWPVFFCMHGGGQNPKAAGPHTWRVNTGEWMAQMHLTEKLWDSAGIYIIPRMGDDRLGRWYHAWVQEFMERMVRRAILFNEANPNRVYLEGISEGGYGCFRLAAFMPDYWAGVVAMAAAEPMEYAPPENLRNVAFRCSMGEHDTMYGRIHLARKYFEKLEELAKEDGAYVHCLDEQKGRGHGIDYKEGPSWAAKHQRDPVPKKLVWTVNEIAGKQRTRNSWLKVEEMQDVLPLKLVAEVKDGNRIVIDAKKTEGEKLVELEVAKLGVYLDERLVDITREVSVLVNGVEVFKGLPQPSMHAIVNSTFERGDPEMVYAYYLAFSDQKISCSTFIK